MKNKPKLRAKQFSGQQYLNRFNIGFDLTQNPMVKNADFDKTFTQLKKVLEPFAAKLIVAADTPTYYALETPHVMRNKRRLYFAGIKIGKAYVSYHLLPLYMCPEMQAEISEVLKKRMQGKACFNFSQPDEKLFKELGKLTRLGYKRFTSKDVYTKF